MPGSIDGLPKASELLREHQQSVYKRTDRNFAVLMIVQWVAAVGAAIWVSPWAWAGTASSLHPHVVAAVMLGGIITALPVFLATTRPGHTLTRHVIAVAQMLMSALLIHLAGGRIETHFHVFGSLAFLACYRDWRVLVSATIVVIGDHLLRGLFWPYSVYGVLNAPVWRSFEHGGWVLFEDVFLFVVIRQSVDEMRSVAMARQVNAETSAELSRSEKALRNQTQILESVLTSMGDGVVVADCAGAYLVFNPAAKHILHAGCANTPPENWTEELGVFLPDTTTPCPVDDLPLVRAMRGESIEAADFFVSYRAGRDGGWISANARPLRDPNGSLMGGVMVFRDITASKQSEEALHKAKLSAEAANLSKSSFLANMSHEIRTPLSSILGFTELIRRGIGTKDEQRSYFETISAGGRHLSGLIDDILDLSKIEAGRIDFERVRCSPHQVISEALSVLRVRAQQQFLSLECRWTSGVPETIWTDPARLRQLLMNLIGNAIKFTEQGSVTLLASVTWDEPEPRFQIEVRDTGIGIPQDRLESIFNPFEQADSSITRRFGGTGLGLAISRQIVEGLGGTLTVESEVGRGSTFRVTLATGPLDGIRMLESPPSEALHPGDGISTATVADISGARLLLVEDGVSNRELLSLVLREAGADVTCAENGLAGVKAAMQSHYDLILMDMQMPVMDGYTATQRLRELHCAVPIIALTAHAMRSDRDKCLAAGCSGYLTKPIDIDKLIRTVSDALRPSGVAPWKQVRPNVDSAVATRQSTDGAIFSTLPTKNVSFKPIVEGFLVRLHEQRDEVRLAYAQADWTKVAEIGHWLRGSGGTIGFSCFTEPATRLEQLATTRQTEQLDRVIEEISALIDRIEAPS